MKSKVYTENQNFWNWWLIALFVIIIGIQLKELSANNWTVTISDFIGFGILFAVLVLFLLMRLHTTVDFQGISIRFLPFVRNKTWLWEQIEDLYIKEYSFLDYGGWGYRVSRNGIAYNTKGKFGMQLILKNGSRIMIGTQHPEELQQIIDDYRNSNI
ncbi:MAG: hypothetical protein ACI35V_03225 [Sphingobacterium composti]|uniref:hypothetical protein n=1 Tax=Sphingobacterium composti TaxID=363260 RepID=UPI00135846B0|nr:hypothetical protein [Sphingobacterium composti Ten et al. 2007 non Yoo et al. 2007]